MQRIYLGAALALAHAGAAMADPVEGLWASAPNEDGAAIHVEIGPCGANYCGTISKVLGSPDTSSEGRLMIWDMAPEGAGVYSGGQVWAPDTDKTYRGKMELRGNVLKISGCVLGGAICRGSDFSRIR